MPASGILWREEFTGTAGNPDLATHTPDTIAGGAAPGSWQGAQGSCIINSTTSVAQDNANNSGNRRFTQDLGTAEYSVVGDFAFPGIGYSASLFLGFGVRATGVTQTSEMECTYNSGGGSPGSWNIAQDGVAGGLSLTEAWPGGVVRIQVDVSDREIVLSADGVRKLSYANPPAADTGRWVSLILGNFSGAYVATSTCSLVEVRTLARASAIPSSRVAVMRASLW